MQVPYGVKQNKSLWAQKILVEKFEYLIWTHQSSSNENFKTF